MKTKTIKIKKLNIRERKDSPRIFFNIESITKSEDSEGRRIVEGYLAKAGPDRTDIWFRPQAFDTAVKNLTENSTVFLNHDWEREIGKVLSVRVDDGGIWVKCMISKAEDDIWTKLKEEVLNSFSIGFSILEFEKEYDEEDEVFTYWVTKAEFYDTSIVGLPANAGAKIEDVYIEKYIKSIERFMKSSFAEVKAHWTRAYINDLPDSAFAVIEPDYKNGNTEDKGARHLPHHDGAGDLGGKHSDRNVDAPHLRNALSRVNQIKPITDSITTSELRKKASAHLEKHSDVLEEEDDKGLGGNTVKKTIKQLLKSLNISVEIVGKYIDLEDEGAMAKLEDIKTIKGADENFDAEAYLKSLVEEKDSSGDAGDAGESGNQGDSNGDESNTGDKGSGAEDDKKEKGVGDESGDNSEGEKSEEGDSEDSSGNSDGDGEGSDDGDNVDGDNVNNESAKNVESLRTVERSVTKSIEASKAIEVQVKEFSNKLSDSIKDIDVANEKIKSLTAQVKSLENSQITRVMAEDIFADLLSDLPDMDEIKKSVQNIEEVNLKKVYEDLPAKERMRLILKKQLSIKE